MPEFRKGAGSGQSPALPTTAALAGSMMPNLRVVARDALLKAFPSPQAFANVVYLWTDEKIDDVDLGQPPREFYTDLVNFADDQGGDRLRRYLQAALQERPGNESLRQAAGAFGIQLAPEPAEPKPSPLPGIGKLVGLAANNAPPPASLPAPPQPGRAIRLRLTFKTDPAPGTGGNRAFSVRAEKLIDDADTPAGDPVEVTAECPEKLLAAVARLEAVILDSAQTRGNSAPQAVTIGDSLRELGTDVLKLAMPDPVLDLYRAYQREIAVGLRTGQGEQRGEIVIEINASAAPVLCSVPWELAFDGVRGGAKRHVCLFSDSPLRRTLSTPVSWTRRRAPVRVLGLIANPRLEGLDTSLMDRSFFEEKGTIEQALKLLVATGKVELQWVEGSSIETLEKRLRRPGDRGWSVLHYTGHGGFDPERGEGFLMLERNGQVQQLYGSDLAALAVPPVLPPPGLVVLNCCNGAQTSPGIYSGSIAEKLLEGGIPAVVAMQFQVTEPAARAFSEAFYQAVADGLTVQQAVTEGRLRMKRVRNAEWVTPALYMTGSDFALVERSQ